MIVTETKFKDCFILQPQIFKDKRGYFIESFNQKAFEKSTGQKIKFVQDNESLSAKGVLRGLHFQVGEHAQSKLLRVIKGRVLDIAVDIRKDSKTYGEHFSIELSEDNKTQLFVPKGFAHGFVVLENDTIFSYKCDKFYCKEAESGLIYNDKDLNINWRLPEEKLIISDKDLVLPTLKEFSL